jgi:hypothetical protein
MVVGFPLQMMNHLNYVMNLQMKVVVIVMDIIHQPYLVVGIFSLHFRRSFAVVMKMKMKLLVVVLDDQIDCDQTKFGLSMSMVFC